MFNIFGQYNFFSVPTYLISVMFSDFRLQDFNEATSKDYFSNGFLFSLLIIIKLAVF